MDANVLIALPPAQRGGLVRRWELLAELLQGPLRLKLDADWYGRMLPMAAEQPQIARRVLSSWRCSAGDVTRVAGRTTDADVAWQLLCHPLVPSHLVPALVCRARVRTRHGQQEPMLAQLRVTSAPDPVRADVMMRSDADAVERLARMPMAMGPQTARALVAGDHSRPAEARPGGSGWVDALDIDGASPAELLAMLLPGGAADLRPGLAWRALARLEWSGGAGGADPDHTAAAVRAIGERLSRGWWPDGAILGSPGAAVEAALRAHQFPPMVVTAIASRPDSAGWLVTRVPWAALERAARPGGAVGVEMAEALDEAERAAPGLRALLGSNPALRLPDGLAVLRAAHR